MKATLGERGQVVIPKPLRDRMGLRPGQGLSLVAGRPLAGYRSEGAARERILPGFLIGTHALLHADRSLTRDRGFYRRSFADLVVTDPGRA